MNNTYKVSYLTVLALIFLLPLFFIPALSVPLGLSKSMLLAAAALLAFVALVAGMFRHEGASLPGHTLMWTVLLLPAVYFVSALASDTPALSLFGYSLEIGTAASMAVLAALMGVTAIAFRDRERLVKGYSALFLSLSILALFALVKIFSGGSLLTLDNFAGVMGTPAGAWTDYAMVFGLLSVLAILALEMLSLKGVLKALVYAAFGLSLALMAAANFAPAWWLALLSAVVLFVYFITVERGEGARARVSRPGVIAAGILGAVALLFIWNPVVSSTRGTVSGVTAELFGTQNADVRPTLSTTLDVSKSVIKSNPVLGSGPNTFGKDWLLYKPEDVNSSPFWNVVFPFGAGFVPTQASSTGLLGTAVWTLFFIMYAALGLRALSKSPSSKTDRFLVVGSLLGSLFLWISTFAYAPGAVVLALAFVLTGMFVAASAATGVIGERTLAFSKNRLTHFAAVLTMLFLVVGAAAFAIVSYQKVSAVVHFQRAIALSNTPDASLEGVETEIVKAVNLSPADPFFRALSDIELSRANAALNSATSTKEESLAAFQASLGRAIAYAGSAIDINPTYGNWVALGNIYASLVPKPLSVEGALDEARSAYESAEKTNPTSPEVPLLMARLELAKGDTEPARDFITEALRRKTDYAEAYFLLAQLEIGENNLAEAIRNAETGVVLTPGNAGVLFQLGFLKYSNRDYAGAADAMKRALALVPEYANAKYYLGLSLDALGRKDEALKEFEDLAQTNPGNQAIMEALENMRAGRPAAPAPVASATDTTPPISGQ